MQINTVQSPFQKDHPYSRKSSNLKEKIELKDKKSLAKKNKKITSFTDANKTFPYKELQNNREPYNLTYHQADQIISHIEDPLWKHVCTEIISLGGPFLILSIWDSRLGALTPRVASLDLYCRAEEGASLVHQYGFLILGSLKRYFPALKELKVKKIH